MRRMYSKTELENIVKVTKKNFTSLVDSSGNVRFQQGTGTPLEQTGFTSSYCKWSLSGTHLMCVLAASISNGTTLAFGANIASFSLPAFIKNKIVGVAGNLIEYKKTDCIDSSFDVTQLSTYFEKNSSGVAIVISSAYTAAADCTFRIQFDLLID